jgi:hypothetical protein
MESESIYWYSVLLTFFYIIYKNYHSSIKVLIILCFYSGLASFLGKGIENPYKIVLVLLSMYILLKDNGLYGLKKRETILLIVFIIFSISFLLSAFVNGDYFTLVFSQYGKYITPICLFFIFNRIQTTKPNTINNLKELFFSLLTIQIILSVLKIITIGLQESTVGSLAYIGGGPATILPVLGFILFWLHKRGKFNRKDWIYVFLLLFIGFASLKRAIWFIMPVFIFLFMFYVSRKLSFLKLLYFLPLIPLIFYVGIRLSPTLNKEGKIGGSFDLQYVLDYNQKYNFGKTSESSEIQLGQGRGGATFLLWGKLFKSQSLSFNDYFGFGLKEVYTTDYEQFDNEKFGVNSKGAVTGIFQTYIATGFVGVILTIILIISVITFLKEPRIRVPIALFIFWDYLFYSGLILRTQSLSIMFFFIIIYSNFQYEHRLYENRAKLKLNDKNRNLQVRPA